MRIRIVPTASGKHAIQVVSKRNNRVTVHKHIGTFANNEEKSKLTKQAETFINQSTGQTSLLDLASSFRPSDVQVSENRPLFLYQILAGIYDKLGFNAYPDPLIRDLVIARVYSPASKRETKEILSDFFNHQWSLLTIYRHLKTGIEKGLKDTFQKALIGFAKDGLGDSLRLVFYDVTTLYFESVAKDELRNFGFSKEHRSMETQVIVGLVVNKDGFPLYFDVFSGNTFEGHTFVPVIKNVQKLLGNTDLVIVADSAMISQSNIEKLIAENIGFIVGARIANLPTGMIDSISDELRGQDRKVCTATYRGQRLICQYVSKRAFKDRADRLKQITKAQKIISTPSAATSRFKFVKADGKKYILNNELLTKSEKLEGIKGYLTNTKLSEDVVIDRYHDLWKVEQSFRITKSDLEARPIFHRLDETIKAHLVIVFAGLAIAKYIEMKTGMSIQKVLKLAEKVLTHKVTNRNTGEIAYVETTIEDLVLKEKIELLKTLGH